MHVTHSENYLYTFHIPNLIGWEIFGAPPPIRESEKSLLPQFSGRDKTRIGCHKRLLTQFYLDSYLAAAGAINLAFSLDFRRIKKCPGRWLSLTVGKVGQSHYHIIADMVITRNNKRAATMR